MRVIRHRLLALVLVVVTGQLASALATSVVLCEMTATAPVARDAITCTCAHGSMAECPMHGWHKTAGSSTRDASSRETHWCNGCDDSSEMVLTTLLIAGTVVDRVRAADPESVFELLVAIPTRPIDAVLPLVSPPPRA